MIWAILPKRRSKNFFQARRPDAFYSDRRSLIWAVLQTRNSRPFSTTTKKENGLTDKDFSNENNEKTENVISSFFAIEGEYKDYCSEYVNVLFKNLIRFVGDDFTPLQSAVTDSNDTSVIQELCGDFNAVSAITADNKAAAVFASRFAEEEITDMDYANDAISEFLNLSNGLYNVNISETTGKEIGLNPPETATSSTVSGIKSKFTLTIPVEYTFGTVVFTLAVI